MNIPKNFIHLMIRDGAPIINNPKSCDNHRCIDFYSGDNFRTDWNIANTFLEALKQHGINYEKCHGWQDGSESGFNGTDSDCINNDFILCTVVLNDGSEQKFCVKTPYDMSASKLAMILVNPIDLSAVIDACEVRLNCKKNKREYFQYNDFCIQVAIK